MSRKWDCPDCGIEMDYSHPAGNADFFVCSTMTCIVSALVVIRK